uniref:Uncharacterized protein n=1 Tax=Babesia bovis TaxID=5865 RepID=S6BAI3_BABBO|nr:conserved hypothetical protein [Babesia bovis]
MGPGIAKLLSALLIAISGLVGCLVPYLVYYFSRSGEDLKLRQDKIDSRLCLCNCLGSGIIMGMAYLHILPEAVSQWEVESLLWNIGTGHFNPAYFLAMIAFCIMLLIERVLSSGRTPCSAAFNICNESNSCWIPEKEGHCCDSEVKTACCNGEATGCCKESEAQHICCESEMKPPCAGNGSRSETCEEGQTIVTGAIDEESESHRNPMTIRARFRHHHSRLMKRFMEIICPLCECNGLCITFALFLHSLFEGIVIGLVESQWNIWLMTVGIALHKWAAGMALSSFISSNSRKSALVMQTIFCLSSPLGILVGAITAGRSPTAEAVLNCFAVGTLIYIGMEIITHELFCHIHCRKTAFWKWLCVVIGLMVIFTTAIIQVYITGGCAHSHLHQHAAEHGHAVTS